MKDNFINAILAKYNISALYISVTRTIENVAIENALQLEAVRRHASPFPL